MATKIVKYIPKITTAGTEYREISEEDKADIMNTCIHILSVMAEFDSRRDEDSKWVRDQWWHKRTDKVHKAKTGQNTPCSVIGGIIYNMIYKDPKQRDFSDKQMSDLEYITSVMSNVYEGIPAYRFQIAIG